MTPQNPAVSILMPVHNGLPYLTDALDDLLAQTFTDFELVVVDDASTDGSAAVLTSYAARDERIVTIRNEENMGLPASLNRGLEQCRAPLVARADSDDRYAPDRLEKQVAFMETHPEVGLLSSACHKIDEDGVRFRTVDHHPTEDGEIRIRELFVNSMSHPGAMFRRDLVLQAGGYDPSFWTSEDADLWARLRPLTRMANLPEPLLAYRKHGSQMVQTRESAGARLSLSVRQRLLQDYLERPLSLDETETMSNLFRGAPVPPEDIDVGRMGLWEVLDRAKQQETPETVRYYKREVAAALLQQVSNLSNGHREHRRQLLTDIIRLDPSSLLSRRMVRQVARSFLPEPAVEAVRTVKSAAKRIITLPFPKSTG